MIIPGQSQNKYIAIGGTFGLILMIISIVIGIYSMLNGFNYYGWGVLAGIAGLSLILVCYFLDIIIVKI